MKTAKAARLGLAFAWLMCAAAMFYLGFHWGSIEARGEKVVVTVNIPSIMLSLFFWFVGMHYVVMFARRLPLKDAKELIGPTAVFRGELHTAKSGIHITKDYPEFFGERPKCPYCEGTRQTLTSNVRGRPEIRSCPRCSGHGYLNEDGTTPIPSFSG